MSHSKVKQEDIKSRAPFSKTFSKRCADSKSIAPVMKASVKPRIETLSTTRVIMVTVSRKEAIFYGLSNKETIVDAIHVEDEENLEGG